MYTIKEAIIVEGVYDKIKLSRFVDGVIFAVNGFQIFSDKKMIQTIKTVCEKTGVVILTDSDAAGFKIRNFIKQQLPHEYVKHAYVPCVAGKDKRKTKPGKEGLLGVESINDDIIINALIQAGCEINGCEKIYTKSRSISKTDFYQDGFSGGPDSAALRRKMAQMLNLPARISANMLLDVLNRILDYNEYIELVNSIKDSIDVR